MKCRSPQPRSRLPMFGAVAGILLSASLVSGQVAETTIDGNRALVVPTPGEDLKMLGIRRFSQERSIQEAGVFADFRFNDELEHSGITFRHHSTDDSGKTWKPAHYDHGNGLLVADVDGDQRLDLYFLDQVGGNGLWRGLGAGRFEDITERAGVAVADRISVSGAFADIDNDGDPDLFVTTVRGGNLLFRNEGGGRFVDVSENSGLAYTGHSSGVQFFDFDLDGDLDLFVANVGTYTGNRLRNGGFYEAYEDAFFGHTMKHRTEASLLYRNRGDGTYEEVSAAMGLVDTGWSGDAAFFDWNGDRYPDLYVLNMQGDDHFWVNEGGTSFHERGAEIFPKTPWGSMGVRVFDWNNDALPDLFLSDMHSDMSAEVTSGWEEHKSLIVGWTETYMQDSSNNIFGNAFFENRGHGRFEEVSDHIGAENYWPWGISVGDLNADGWPDAFVASSMNYPFRYGFNSVLLNDQGKRFQGAELVLGIEPRQMPHTPFFELDCSGTDQNHRLCEGRTGRFVVYGTRGTRASAIFDIDDDGDLDIVTSEFNDRPQVFVSDLSSRRPVRFLKVALAGSTSNRDGLGARVQVTAGGRTYTQWQDGKSGYLSQSSMPLYFGLDAATSVDRLEVLWPSGKTQTVNPPSIGATATVREP